MSQLTLKQLQALLAVRETGNFHAAAERVGVTQPALSMQIQNLEEALGAQLVERGRPGVNLTILGREVVEHAARIADEAQAILDLAHGHENPMVGTIRLGTTPTLGPYILPRVVAHLYRQNQLAGLYVRESMPVELQGELSRGVHDVLLTQTPTLQPEHRAVQLFSEPLFLAMPADHPLKAREEVSLDDLAGIHVLTLSSGFNLQRQVHSICERAGAHVHREYEGTSLDALRQMVGMGMGVTFLPATYVHSEINRRSEVIVRPMKGREFNRIVSLVWRKSVINVSAFEHLGEIIRQIAGSVNGVTVL